MPLLKRYTLWYTSMVYIMLESEIGESKNEVEGFEVEGIN